MRIMVDSLLRVMQDVYHQPYIKSRDPDYVHLPHLEVAVLGADAAGRWDDIGA